MNTVRFGGNGRMSQVVDCGEYVFLAGQTANSADGDIAVQTREVLAKIDACLDQVGLSRRHLVSVQIWLKRIERDFAAMNAVWDDWVAEGAEPARATVEAALARDALLVEIAAIARRDPAVTHLGPS